MDLRQEMARAFERRPDKKKSELARLLGRQPSAVSDMLDPDKPRRIRADEIQIIREYLELDGAMVPVVGYVGAGSEAHYYREAADTPSDMVPAPAGASPDTVAVEIRGGSLGPAFDGAYAFYDDRQEPLSESLHGALCVVWLDTGQILIKIPRPARQRGRYHLFSNGPGEPILDAKVVAGAKVIDIRPK